MWYAVHVLYRFNNTPPPTHKVVPLALDEHNGLKNNELKSLFYLQNWNRRHPA